jgi:hypothetical protein
VAKCVMGNFCSQTFKHDLRGRSYIVREGRGIDAVSEFERISIEVTYLMS